MKHFPFLPHTGYHENMHQSNSRLLLVHVAEPPAVAGQRKYTCTKDLWGGGGGDLT